VAPVFGALLVGCCLAVLAGAASAGLGSARDEPSSTSSVRAARTATAGSWGYVVAGLDERRARAWGDGSTSLLSAVYAPSAPAGRRDLAALAALSRAGTTAHGVRPRLRSAVALWPPGATPTGPAARVVLEVVDTLPPAILVDASGRPAVSAGRGERRWRLTLVRLADQWRIEDVAAA